MPAPLATRHRSEAGTGALAHLLGVPRWHRNARDVIQCRGVVAVDQQFRPHP
ncbi:hypothetical protein [Nocardioides sp. B-3]|uniref:hypothetical protein n=1 Tax=Nocardioides sp. B-3 TaxID=2895565 RepID=UPI002153798D|nr:hypothetical protein [Nocardioides sp. B-3]UUZ60420.1 hypothetical protein LP418_05850 [Nocardioides sp. B-3]